LKDVKFAAWYESAISMGAQVPKIKVRRACGLLGIARLSCRYKARKQLINKELEAELRMLAREGGAWAIDDRIHCCGVPASGMGGLAFNAKTVHRLYKKASPCACWLALK
jgi:hypothetical protein